MPVNLLAPQVRVPSISRAAGNALSMQRAKTGNLLAEKQLGSYDENQKRKSYFEDLQVEASAINSALRAGNTKQATDIYKRLGGKAESGITIAGPNVTVDYGNTTFSGPGQAVSELMENIAKQPSFALDPATNAWAAARGISTGISKGGLAREKSRTGSGGDRKGKALKRISDISKSIATLEKTDMITQLLAKDNPELAKLVGQKIPPEKKAALMKAWNEELDYLEQSSGTNRKEKITPTDGKIRKTFQPGTKWWE